LQQENITNLNIDLLIPNPNQPRKRFDDKALKELALSIKEYGIINPILVREKNNLYEIIAGERRYKAASLAGLSSVPAIVTEMDDDASAEVALIENVQRKDLTSIEEAKSYKNMLDRGNMTQEELAKKMGLSQSTIANKLRLLNLSDEVQKALMEEKISERHARSLLSISDKEEQVKWLNRIINERLTVRQLDLAIKDEESSSKVASEVVNDALIATVFGHDVSEVNSSRPNLFDDNDESDTEPTIESDMETPLEECNGYRMQVIGGVCYKMQLRVTDRKQVETQEVLPSTPVEDE
jgi:ParB family chromosome partitioning protein